MALIVASACESGGPSEPDVAFSVTIRPSDDPPPDEMPQPQPDESIDETLKRFNFVVARQDCEMFRREFDVLGVIFDQARPCESTLARIDGARFTDEAEFGTAAIAEAPGPDGVETAVFVLYDSRFRFLFATDPGEPQLGTDAAPAAKAERNVTTFVDGVIEENCDKIVPVLNPAATLALSFHGDLEFGCESIVRGVLFAPSLAETPQARPEPLGHTRDFAFFGISTRGAYFTIVLGTTPGEPDDPEMRVIDVLPSTPV
jgi:hypothetical protein